MSIIKIVKAKLFYYIAWPILVKLGFEVVVNESGEGPLVLDIFRR